MKKIVFFFLFINTVSFLKAETKDKIDSILQKNDTIKQIEIFERAEVMPIFPGGTVELMKYLSSNIRYPKLARENGLQGKVIIKFYIDIDGSVKEPVILKDGVGGGCSEESIRVINSMPKWTPGSQRGKPVRVYYTLPITYKLGEDGIVDNSVKNLRMDPVFPGGNVELEFYKQEILSKIKKPKAEKFQKIIVEVMVTFNDLGKIESVFVIKDNTDNLKNISIILDGIKSMPNWYPATLNGKTVMSQKILIFEY